jgi:hypothetical protein
MKEDPFWNLQSFMDCLMVPSGILARPPDISNTISPDFISHLVSVASAGKST